MVRFSKKIHPSTEHLRPENHIQVETDNTDEEDGSGPPRRSCCCPSLFSRCKCCKSCTDKCKQSKMYDRVCGRCCQSNCCKGITSRLGSICSKLNVCKKLPNPCSKLQCCSKLKSCSTCCKRKPRDVDVEKGLQGAADVTCAKRFKNFWRLMCCLNTACCLKLRDKCGCCKKLSCCRMGGCCGPLTQEEEAERQKRARMKVKRMSQQISQVPKEHSKIDPTLVEHQSIMRAAIPILPVSLAWVCLMLNVVIPGSGTFMSGLFCLCIGKPRFQVNDTRVGRFGAFIVQCLVAMAQLFTILFCLVGWGWSIWWGTIMLKLAKKHQRIKHAERHEAETPVTNQNHVVDNI